MTVHHAPVIALFAVVIGISALVSMQACTGAQQTLDELRALAEQGDAEAQHFLGLTYADGRGVPEGRCGGRSVVSPCRRPGAR